MEAMGAGGATFSGRVPRRGARQLDNPAARLDKPFAGHKLMYSSLAFRGSSSVGRALASQAGCRGSESRLPLLPKALRSNELRKALFVYSGYDLQKRLAIRFCGYDFSFVPASGPAFLIAVGYAFRRNAIAAASIQRRSCGPRRIRPRPCELHRRYTAFPWLPSAIPGRPMAWTRQEVQKSNGLLAACGRFNLAGDGSVAVAGVAGQSDRAARRDLGLPGPPSRDGRPRLDSFSASPRSYPTRFRIFFRSVVAPLVALN